MADAHGLSGHRPRGGRQLHHTRQAACLMTAGQIQVHARIVSWWNPELFH
jgi:hypothetical protein